MMQTSPLTTSYKTIDVELDETGIMTIRFHSRQGPMIWNALPHREVPRMFAEVAALRDVRAIIITGTGDRFMQVDTAFEGGIAAGVSTPVHWDEGLWEGRSLLESILALDVPVIAAVNGPADVHAEIALLSDIVLCTEDSWFSDEAHFACGLVPSDGVQILWPMLLGPNRGRYFLLTGQRIQAAEALDLGVVSEVLPSRDELMERARAHAARLAVLNPVVLHNTRRALVRSLRATYVAELDAGLALESLASLAGASWEGPVQPAPMDAR